MSELTGQDQAIIRTHIYTVLAEHPFVKMMRDEALKNLANDLIDQLDGGGWLTHSADIPERPLDSPVDTIARAAIYNLAGAVMRHASRSPVDPTLVDLCVGVQDLVRSDT